MYPQCDDGYVQWATSEAEFIKKLSNPDAELKKSVAYKKRV